MSLRIVAVCVLAALAVSLSGCDDTSSVYTQKIVKGDSGDNYMVVVSPGEVKAMNCNMGTYRNGCLLRSNGACSGTTELWCGSQSYEVSCADPNDSSLCACETAVIESDYGFLQGQTTCANTAAGEAAVDMAVNATKLMVEKSAGLVVAAFPTVVTVAACAYSTKVPECGRAGPNLACEGTVTLVCDAAVTVRECAPTDCS